MASTGATTDDSSTSSGGLSGALGGMARLADPQLLMSLGMGLMAGARYGSNAGMGLLQGLSTYQDLKTSQLQNQLQRQQIQAGDIANQRQRMMLGAAQQALQGDQGASPPAASPTAPPAGGLSGALSSGAQAPFLPGISPMPASGASVPDFLSGVSAPPTAPGASAPAQQGLPSGLTPPSMSQIYGTTYPGSASPNYMRAMAMFSQDPAAALLKFRDDQLKGAQQQYAPTIARLDQLIKSDAPAKYLNGTGFEDVKAAWPQLASTLGLDPDKDYNDQNVRLALSHVRNQMASSLQEPTSEPAMPLRTIRLPDGRMAQIEPGTGKITPIASEDLQSVLGPNGRPTLVPRSQAAGMTPFNQVTYGNAQMQDPKVGALDAALTTAGVNLPGTHNSSQYASRLMNLINNNPGLSPQDLANQIRTGQLDYSGTKRTVSQISTMAGVTDIANRQIEKNFNSLEPLVSKYGVPTLNNWINSLERNLTPGGSKDATEAQGYLLALAGEYAKIRSGGTGAAAPAEGEQKEALAYIQSVLTQGGFEGARAAIVTEARNKRDSIREGLQMATAPGASVGGSSSSSTATGIKLDKGQSHTVGGFTVTRTD